jgi:hypothetical protein
MYASVCIDKDVLLMIEGFLIHAALNNVSQYRVVFDQKGIR